MKRFTFGTTPEDVIREALPHKYSMELNKNDMIHLLELLNSTSPTFSDFDEMIEWANGMRSNILSTIGIEEV